MNSTIRSYHTRLCVFSIQEITDILTIHRPKQKVGSLPSKTILPPIKEIVPFVVGRSNPMTGDLRVVNYEVAP